ncbi:hypothetical protein BS78_05G077300 [Paspalum vaginatum]|nr:hypothetical protein BS78_05G077300 [Paspalum vaginatum]
MERPSIQTKALLLLLLLVVEGTEAGYEPQGVEVEFNLDERPISELLDLLRAILADNWPRLRIAGGVYLSPKHAAPHSPPSRWLKVTLITGSARATLAIDDCGIDLHAFRNLAGDWHAFPGYDRTSRCSPARRRCHGGYDNLVHVALGRVAAATSVETMSGYDPSSTPDADVRRALATLSLIISEALRFKSVRQTVTEHWERLAYLTMDQVHDLQAWGADLLLPLPLGER